MRLMRLIAVAFVAAAIGAGTAQATAGSGVSSMTILQWSYGRTTYTIRQFTILPGGYSGWHSHVDTLNLVVMAGTGTLYTPFGTGCRGRIHPTGSPVVEFAGQPVNLRNEGSQPLVTLVITSYPSSLASDGVDQPKPPDCPF